MLKISPYESFLFHESIEKYSMNSPIKHLSKLLLLGAAEN